MGNERFKELLIKKKSGEISLPEQRELSSLLQNSIADEAVYNIIEDFYETPLSFENTINRNEIEAAVSRLNKKITSQQFSADKSARLLWVKISAIAASLIIILGNTFLFSESKKVFRDNQNIIATKKGSKSTIVLPDGSKVWINDDTKITYAKSFGDGAREVTLTGEAYFDVIKDPKRPFIVHTQTLDVKVLGTAFNVRAYPNEKNTQTTLLRGSVEVVLNKEKAKRIMLKPYEKIIVQNGYAQPLALTKNPVNLQSISVGPIQFNLIDSSAMETQWMKNRLAFEGDKLEDAAIILERWYNIKVIIRDVRLRNKKVSGVFEDRSLNNVMEALSLAVGFKYKIDTDNNAVIISQK